MKESYFSRMEFGFLLNDTWAELCGVKPERNQWVKTNPEDLMKPREIVIGPIFKHQFLICDGRNKVQFEIELPHISYRDRVSEEFITGTITKLKALESEIRPSEVRPNMDDYTFRVMTADRVGAFARKIEKKVEYKRAVMEEK